MDNKDKRMITMYGISTLIVTIVQIIISQKRQPGMYEVQNLFAIVLVMTGILLLLCKGTKTLIIYGIIVLQLFVMIGIDISVYQKGIMWGRGEGITMQWPTIWIVVLIVCGFIQLYIAKPKKEESIKNNIQESKKRLNTSRIKHRETVSNVKLDAKTAAKKEKWEQWKTNKMQGYSGNRRGINPCEIIAFILATTVVTALVCFPVTVAWDEEKTSTAEEIAQAGQNNNNIFREWMDGINVISDFINVELKSNGKRSDNNPDNKIEYVTEDAGNSQSKDKDDTRMTGMQAIAQYVLLSTAILGCIVTVIVILQRFMADLLVKIMGKIVASKSMNPLEDEDFVKKYAMPICALVLAMSILSAFVGEISDELLTKCWYQLLIVIMAMMILLVAIEIMRLIIEQSVHRYSLLIRCIHFVYILVMNLTMSLVIGVIRNINVPEIISELGGNSNHKNEELIDEVTGKIYEALNDEIMRFEQDGLQAKNSEELKSTIQKVR